MDDKSVLSVPLSSNDGISLFSSYVMHCWSSSDVMCSEVCDLPNRAFLSGVIVGILYSKPASKFL